MGMTIEEIKKEMWCAKTVVDAINNTKKPMLICEKEKEVTEKALRKYIDELANELKDKLGEW